MWNIELRLLSNGRGITSGNTAVPSELNSVGHHCIGQCARNLCIEEWEQHSAAVDE